MWQRSHPVSEWMVQKLEPLAGDTILELSPGLADTGFTTAHLVGETGRVIITDFAPEIIDTYSHVSSNIQK